jgi:hypothetical protein
MSEPTKRRVTHPVLLAVFLIFVFSLALLVILLPIYGTQPELAAIQPEA